MRDNSTPDATDTDEFDVFISHASEDKQVAYELCGRLESLGAKCWIAPRNVRNDKNYLEEILEGVRNSKSLLLVLSENTKNSNFVVNEVERAKSYRKALFTVRFEDVGFPFGLELILSSEHWVDAWAADYEDRLQDIAGIIDERPRGPITKPALSQRTKVLRWARKNGIGLATLCVLLVIAVSFLSNSDSSAPEVSSPASISKGDTANPSISATDYTSLNELTPEDFRLTADLGVFGCGKVRLSIVPKSARLSSSVRLLSKQYSVSLDLGKDLVETSVDSLFMISVELPALDEFPKSVTLTIQDFEDKGDPLILELPTPQVQPILDNCNAEEKKKALTSTISTLQHGSNHYCSGADGIVQRLQRCHLGSIVSPIPRSLAVASISKIYIGDPTNWDHVINVQSGEVGGRAGLASLSNKDKFEFIFPLLADNYSIQLEFSTGERSRVAKLSTLPPTAYSQALALRPLSADAPPVALSFSNASDSGAIIAFLENDAQDATWHVYRGLNKSFSQSSGAFLYVMNGSLGEDIDFEEHLTIRYVRDGVLREHGYSLDVSAKALAKNLENLNKRSKDLVQCDSQRCYFGWLKVNQDTLDLVKEVYVGIDSQHLYPVSRNDFTVLNESINDLRLSMLEEEQERLQSEGPDHNLLSFGTTIQIGRAPLVERLKEPKVFSSSELWNDFANTRQARFLEYTFRIDRLFLQLEWVDGAKSEIFMKRPASTP